MRIPKAVPVVLRKKNERTEVLLFEHPLAGTQLVKGTVEPGESVSEAAARELTEESGLLAAGSSFELGTWERCPLGQVWHFREVQVEQDLPDTWSHFTKDGGGLTFRFFWHPLDAPAPVNCHPVFVAALAFLRSQLSDRARYSSALRHDAA
jgi:8-oxo-dGTP pyrophosphatase MutT (NUDIX family)